MTKVQVGEISLDVIEQGTGETLVLVHGSASDRRTWDSLAPRLAERFRVLSYSRRFHTPNPPPDEGVEYVMAQHVEDLAHVVAQLADGPVDIVGHSYGAFVSLLLAAHHSDLVRRQVLIEPPAVPLFLSEPPKPSELARLLTTKPKLGIALLRFGATGLVPATKAASRNDMEKAIETFGRAVLGRHTFEALSDARREQVSENNIRAEYLSDSLGPLSAAEVRSVEAPTLLISGAQSPRLWPMLSDELHQLLPRSTRVSVPGASHIAHEDNPETTGRQIIDFLAAT